MTTLYSNVLPGCDRRLEIENIFKYPLFQHPAYLQKLQRAIKEYEELLKIELQFSEKDPNKCKAIQKKNRQLSVYSYTYFGEDLEKKYKDSCLIKLIVEGYKKYQETSLRTAIVEFSVLRELSAAFALSTEKISSPGMTQSWSPQKNKGSYYDDQKRDLSKTGTPSNVAYDSRQSPSSKQIIHTDQPLDVGGNKYYHEDLYRQLQNRTTQQDSDISNLQRELKEKNKEIDELRTRLSGFASKQLTTGNPDLADLGDKNRPTKIAETFHTIYDDEWTTALEVLTHAKKGVFTQSEEDAVIFLMEIIKTGYQFCTNYTDKQIQNLRIMWKECLDNPFASAYCVDNIPPKSTKTLSDVTLNEFKQNRKQDFAKCIENATKKFKEEVLVKIKKYESKQVPAVDAYVGKCIASFWLMSVQDPPMVIRWPETGEKFDTDIYKEYLRKGTKVKLAVWPAVFLHEKGPLVNKGFAMPQ